ncbi:PREDICTED: glutathione S-transferase T3-like [Camelina sativa]|uniref:Glutathione S-transferase T3-like n=1 Tax=Camelina sativa TaxID=90675 RepID=A0ABM1QQG6_CAMSA|nr:PREDICTED: glutathione S-transferase T3-like [Camelina sativa]XP_019089004.1 PREDICTED: glutathione S-transferase T3-like [Camelina sativa]XP_019091015.1 PREDICTED: glutathione S-transferase T3-like [Camelina sativa]XP_019094443.1 PREDICTED: glutathione S-transferase T3-like [Camelina sativa]
MDPYRLSDENFVDLLNSQKVLNVSDNPNPPHSAQSSQPIQFSNPFSSEPPHFTSTFSSQPPHFSSTFSSQNLNFSPASDTEDCIEVEETEEDGGRGSRKRWTAEEDVNLISAWLNTSKDPVTSNEQRKYSFWQRVTRYFEANGGSAGSNARGQTQCKARWNKINHQVNKFVGCYAQACTRRKSGESEDDVLRMAYELFNNDMKKPFLLVHCWRELKHDQKWLTEECSHKRTKLASEAPTSSNDGAEKRPPGVKAAKNKGKRPTVSIDVEDGSVHKLDKIIAMKDQEQAAKEKHGKMRLLNSLLNKSELTTAEVALRDKLGFGNTNVAVEHVM